MRRFRVAEDSMRPTLVPGEELVATGARTATVGDVVVLPHPGRDQLWLVKRMAAGPGDEVPGHGRLDTDEAWVVSDNSRDDAVDSRRFGPVPLATLHPMVDRLDPASFAEAVEMLSAEDPALAAVTERDGVPGFWSRRPGFPTLVRLILEQQISLESGAAVYRRLAATVGEVTPETVADLGEAGLRQVGTTRQKARYLLGLAESVRAGGLALDELDGIGHPRARDRLLAVTGIGPWTADAYLLSALRLPDVFPVGDRALRVGAAEVLGLGSVPGPEDLELLSTPWRPVRAAAARLIWHAYLRRRGRVEPPDPLGSHPTGPAA